MGQTIQREYSYTVTPKASCHMEKDYLFVHHSQSSVKCLLQDIWIPRNGIKGNRNIGVESLLVWTFFKKCHKEI